LQLQISKIGPKDLWSLSIDCIIIIMDHNKLMALPMPELLALTQTNLTPDPTEGYGIAQFAFGRAETPTEKGTAARQAGFRAEQAGEKPEVVQHWFGQSRVELSSDDPLIKRELIATELLLGRAMALRIQRIGSHTIELIQIADQAFERGESILQAQHVKGASWDRFGTMLARHRATHEAMNGSAVMAGISAARGLWRALRAERQSTPG
jgi:hypothetical protein